MPKQEGEPPFGDDEQLYRRLLPSWIDESGRVDSSAIEVPECSVDRGLLSTAEQALGRCNEHEIAIASVSFCQLPSTFVPTPTGARPQDQPKTYELVVVPKPDANPAHAHLETRLQDTAEPRAPKGAMKQRIRTEIAATMTVLRRKQ